MKLVVFLTSVFLAVARPDDSVYDNFDFQEILNSREKIIEYTDCFQGIGECTPQSNDLKSILLNALEADCDICTLRQKKCLSIFVFALRKLAFDEDLKLREIFNTGGKYDKTFNAFIEKYGREASC